MLSRFHLIPERYVRTDRQTDRQICYINIALSVLTRDKNHTTFKLGGDVRASESKFKVNGGGNMKIVLEHIFAKNVSIYVKLKKCL